MNLKERLLFFKKISKSISGSPSSLLINSIYPKFNEYELNNINYFQAIVNTINWSLYVLSNTELDLNDLRLQNFNLDVSKFTNPIIKNLIIVSKILFSFFAAKEKATPEHKKTIIDDLKNKISTLIPDGGIDPFLQSKIGGNLKIILLNSLSQIK